jgi:hypothetical protein
VSSGILAITLGSLSLLEAKPPKLDDLSLQRVSTSVRRAVTGSIWYKVDLKNAIAVPDFRVEIRSGDKAIASATTDDMGVFNFPDISPGHYKVCWANPGWFSGCGGHELDVTKPTYAGALEVKAAGHAVYGTVTLAKGENASYIEPFFGVASRASVTVKGTSLKTRANAAGQFVIPNVPPGAASLIANLGAASTTVPISPNALIAIANHRPEFKLSGPSISPHAFVRAKPGETITLDAAATDPDNDQLSFVWQAGSGTKVSQSGSKLKYKAPSKPGVYSVSALVNDGHGGFGQIAFDVRVASANVLLATSGLNCQSIVDYYFPSGTCGAFTPPPPGCSAGQFLQLFKTATSRELAACKNAGIDDQTCGKNSANAYYAAVDPNNARPTLSQFYAVAGFGPDGSGGTRAAYMNDNDLGFGRDMHFIQTGGFIFSYVTNYLNNPTAATTCVVQDPTNAQLAADQKPDNVTATVVMEWAPLDWVGPGTNPASIASETPFVKFFVYDPAGNRLNAAALDPYGAKFVPNLCLNCHGGSGSGWDTTSGGNSANLGASFLPFDLETFKYPSSGIDYASFLTMNQTLIPATNPNAPILEIITGWYAGGGNVPNKSFVPVGWQNNGAPPLTNDDLGRMYYYIVARGCRTCHTSLPSGPNWNTWTDSQGNGFGDNNGAFISSFVLNSGKMPHAFVGLNNMWTSNFWPDANTPTAFNCFANNYSNPTNLHTCLAGLPWPPP